MTTAVASAPAVASLAPPQHEPANNSPRPLPSISTNGSAMTPNKQGRSSSKSSPSSNENSAHKSQSQPNSESKKSPTASKHAHPAPKIFVKKEPPSSPELPTSRHRPRRLDLSTNKSNAPGALSARPSGSLTARDGVAMQDVGLACLSPGFHTQDPTMREQLQRSIDVRDRQRQIIEARQKSAKDIPDGPEGRSDANGYKNDPRTPSTSRRKGPPPGLSIAPPSHERFANERTIQSAPLNQSFTGLRHNLHPASRHLVGHSSNLANHHIQHMPAHQTANRLPPISDVFAPETLGGSRPATSRPAEPTRSPGNVNPHIPLPSPGFPPPSHQTSQPPLSSRRREYKSAEDAVQIMSGGREELLPRIVHYGGHQPPTPPSPAGAKGGPHPSASLDPARSGPSRRRTREEYERDQGSPPLGRQADRPGPFGEPRDSPETQKAKKDEFIQLCIRAWDLFHS